MALTAAAQMCSGVGKSGSPRLKSKTLTPWALSWRARAPAASVADGCTAAAMRETETGASFLDIFSILVVREAAPRRAAVGRGRAPAPNDVLRDRAGGCGGAWASGACSFGPASPARPGGLGAFFRPPGPLPRCGRRGRHRLHDERAGPGGLLEPPRPLPAGGGGARRRGGGAPLPPVARAGP